MTFPMYFSFLAVLGMLLFLCVKFACDTAQGGIIGKPTEEVTVEPQAEPIPAAPEAPIPAPVTEPQPLITTSRSTP